MSLTPIFSSPVTINDKVDNVLIEGLSKQFPVEGKVYRLEVDNLRADRKYYTHDDEKKAILESRSLTYPIKADLRLVNKETGKVIDELKDFSLMDAFHITGKHTLLYKGNNYNAANQLQLLPGVYTRIDNVGNLETHFNTGSGRSFKIELEAQTGLFTITPDSTSAKTPIAPLLTKVFGVGPREISNYVPMEVWNDNLKAVQGKEDRYISALYKKLVSTSKQSENASIEQMCEQLKEAMAASSLHTETTKATLGKSFQSINHETILLAMRNLVNVHSNNRKEDNRDSLQFKRVQNLPDFLTTRFAKEHQVVKLIKGRMARELDRLEPDSAKLKGHIIPKPFNKFMSGYLLDSNLVATPSETNPIESIENVSKVTVLGAGEGGIASDRGVPISARDIDPSHLGIIDPSRTPESGHAGIDQRFTISAARDDSGTLYARVKDRSGNIKHISVHTLMDSVVGFPGQDGQKKVQAQIKGELGECDVKDVDYWLADITDMYTVTTNLVPFLNSNHPGRLTMAGKSIPQALSLVNREAPLVQTTDGDNQPFVKKLAAVISTVSPVKGEVVKAERNAVVIRTADGSNVTVKAVKNLPFNMKGFHDDERPLVKAGDHIEYGAQLYESNYTKDGSLALGRNLQVAYLPWRGYNHEDGLVLSRSAADQLSSHHAYKVDYEIHNTSVPKKALITRYYPGRWTREQLDKLDDRGFAKVGSKLVKGDPVYVVMELREPSPQDKMLARLHKTLVTPYKPATEEWMHDEPGIVVDAHTSSKQVRFIIRSVKDLEIGDKLTGLHGNKGIVSLILEDHQMPFNKETGKPVDILLNPASVTSRTNFGQIMETAAGKIAQKLGKPYLIHNYDKMNSVSELKKELTSHGISDAEELIDPNSKKSLGKILTGPQYFIKLYKTSDQNWSARNVGGYDANLQPSKGGEEGSKSVGYMEMLGLLGSNARKNLKEISTLKSESNQEYWDKFLQGQPLPKPKTTFVTQKFFDYLTGSGIKTTIKNGKLVASPLTDGDIMKMSNGEIKEPSYLNSKNMNPEKNGLFDPAITGGLKGTNWSHYKLAEPIPHPLMERPIKALLGLSTKEFEGLAHGKISAVKEKDVFHLHDTVTGKKIRTVQVNSMKGRPEVTHDDIDDYVDEEAIAGGLGAGIKKIKELEE
jgi:DNA-directed RNA polymerase subunit beta